MSGLLAMSSDFGRDWTTYPLNVSNTLFSMSFLSPFYGYAAGSDGLICFWNGNQWVNQFTELTQDLYSIYAIGTTAYAVGSEGAICRLEGTNWTVLHAGTASINLYDVAFLNENFGYAVGSNGAIYQTCNGGTNWVALDSGTLATLRGIRLIDLNTAWVVGDNGVLLLTVDAGVHWNSISLGTLADLRSIDFVNGLGLIVGKGGFTYVFQQTGYLLNCSPVVRLSETLSNATVCVCSKIPLGAVAYDPAGYITNLELFVGSTRVAQQTFSPLRYGWPNDSLLGTYACVAKATDNLGATSFSPPVELTFVMPADEQLRALTMWPTNGFELCLLGRTSQVYAIQFSTNLANWTPWRNVTNRTGILPLIDAISPMPANKFYRALHQ
ncbi:MAG: WD40/YVTN/BNR-like repeat-containing protein [Candidatus Dormibacteraceae bacterium]